MPNLIDRLGKEINIEFETSLNKIYNVIETNNYNVSQLIESRKRIDLYIEKIIQGIITAE